MELQGRGALVTGAGRGLGRALAFELAKRGARVALVARSRDEVEGVAAAIRAEGGFASAFQADLADKEQTIPLARKAALAVGPIDLLIHNASALGPLPLAPLLDTPCEALAQVLETNLVGPFRLTKALVPSMFARGGGLVVQVSSDAAVNAYENWGAYGLSKAAADHATRTFAAELAGTGVRFVSFDPGEMDTKMHADAIPGADRATLARPGDVARAIADAIARGAFASGDRVVLGGAS